MNISARARTLAFDRHTMWVELEDGRSLSVSLVWFPRLSRATQEQQVNYWIGYSGNGLHWDDLDEDISVEGLLVGQGDCMRSGWHVSWGESKNFARCNRRRLEAEI